MDKVKRCTPKIKTEKFVIFKRCPKKEKRERKERKEKTDRQTDKNAGAVLCVWILKFKIRNQ